MRWLEEIRMLSPQPLRLRNTKMAYDTNSFKERLTDTFGFTIEDSEELARPVSQTPAPPKERIKGSKDNPEGTASTRSKAGDIEISAENGRHSRARLQSSRTSTPQGKPLALEH